MVYSLVARSLQELGVEAIERERVGNCERASFLSHLMNLMGRARPASGIGLLDSPTGSSLLNTRRLPPNKSPPKQQRRISRLFGAYRPARWSQVARLPCIWKENCSDQFISVDSKGSVAQCDCWVTSYPKYFFGNILREPSSRGCSRQALRDATLSSDFLNGKRFLDALAFSAISIGPVDGTRKG